MGLDRQIVEMQFFLWSYGYSIICVSYMRSVKIFVAIALLLMLLIGVVDAVDFGPSSGFVQYQVTVSSPENSIASFTTVLNETAQPSGQNGIIDLTLAVSFAASNFTYSRDVNSSSLPEVFPYLPALTNQSLSYQVDGFSIQVNLVNTGQAAVIFDGTSYQATNFLVSFSTVTSTTSKASTSFSGEGNVTCLPSGLIETAQLSVNQTASVDVTLLSTDLSINAPASNISPIGVSLLGIALLVAIVVAVPTIFMNALRKKPNKQNQENETKTKNSPESDETKENQNDSKPSYEVD